VGFHFGSPLGSLRAAEGGKSGVSETTTIHNALGAQLRNRNSRHMRLLRRTAEQKVAVYMRRKHLSSPRWLRNGPFAGMVMKEWYPVYLRVTGIGGFVCALVWLTLLIRLFSK
jgi:hypothetical protein